jgi:hypothetical protein
LTWLQLILVVMAVTPRLSRNLRLTPDDQQLIDGAVSALGLTRTDLVLQAARAAAQPVLLEQAWCTVARLIPLEAPQPLTGQRRTAGFDCGDISLNQCLDQRALANQRSGATRTFVVCDGDGVVKATAAVPAQHASELIGVRGILVHAASAAARSFYLPMGFDPSPTDLDTLLLRLVDVEASAQA